jgi:MoxR-like ATPase
MSSPSTTGDSPFAASAIEFNCGQCGRHLRVAPTVSGPVKCPACGVIQKLPHGPSGATASSASASTIPRQDAAVGATPTVPTPAPPLGTAAPAAVTPKLSLRADAQWEGGQQTPTRQLFQRIIKEVSKLYVGQDELVLGSLVAIFSSGHVLIESVPGLGKTLFVRTLGRVLGCDFGRIQFTADLMPSDITGAPIFDMKMQEFRFRPGPVFTQLLLADEINRSPAKTHAALLEIMQEFRVTVDGVSHGLTRPFLVLATQNPIESEGTYNLPEAQLDRFMFKLIASYPAETEEAEILKLHSGQMDINRRLEEDVQTVTNPDEIVALTRDNSQVRVDERLIDYINKIVRLTRQWPEFYMGASPRAGIALMQGARTLAAFCGRDYAVPDDVVQLCLPVLRHRVILTAEADVEGQKVDELLTKLVRAVEVPRI